MSLLDAIILGVVQGLTEFLPVSSSGHLELMHALLGVDTANNLTFDMAVHGGTVLSTIVVFWHEIIKIFKGVFKFKLNEETIYAANILVSMIPVLFVGLFFMDQIEGLFTSNLLLVGCMLLLTAGLLAFAHFRPQQHKSITPQRAFVIGIAQAIAVVPGLSRSGATISAGLIQGVKREEVARFSFLMVLIPIIGMNVLELLKGDLSGAGGGVFWAGFLSAFVMGTIACKWMISIVQKGKLIWFSYYCIVVGAVAVIAHYL